MSSDLWQRACERLAAVLPEQQFNTWIRPLAPVPQATGAAHVGTAVTDVVAVQVPNRFKLTGYVRNTRGALNRPWPRLPSIRYGWS
jgi:chromosomal replication initiator protein